MLSLLEMSVTGGILIAVIVIARALGINKLPKKAFLVLWAVALCRLILPFSLPSPASVYSVAEQAGVTVRRPGVLLSQAAPAGGQGGAEVPAALIVWGAVALLFAALFLIVHLRARRNYRISLPVEDPFVAGWLEQHRLRRPVQVRYSDQTTAPFTYGVLWPVILLPKSLDRSDKTRLGFILSHEMAHIRRFDAFWKWVLAAVLCLHWFNPLVWVMYVLANRDLELSCDESVLRESGRDARAPYALTLVGLEEKRTHFMPLASSFSKNALEERITAIMKIKKTTIAGIAAALALVVAVTTVFATNAAPKSTGGIPAPSPSASVSPSPSPSAAPGGPLAKVPGGVAEIKDRPGPVVTNGTGEGGDDNYPTAYTKAQYDLVISALKFEGYEKMSIAEFNRKINAVLNGDGYWDEGGVGYAYEMVMMFLESTDPNAPFLLNTVQASRDEYNARSEEVYGDKRVDPDFRGSAEIYQESDIYGDTVRRDIARADYTFTYRILDQDKLTVEARDQFLQNVMQGAQDYLNGRTPGELLDDKDGEAHFKTALEAAGKAATTGYIEFTGCEVEYYDAFDSYW